jgi:hypothetical protein
MYSTESLKNFIFETTAKNITVAVQLQQYHDKEQVLDLDTYSNMRMDASAVLPLMGFIL